MGLPKEVSGFTEHYLTDLLEVRSLLPEEVRYVTEMARRIAALIALQPALDESYRNVIKATYPWPGK